MLRRPCLAPRLRCSKAPWGLFVLSQVTRIFTRTSISPSPPSRQCSSRYSIRAGRNLPDKEFRYLRTVIVTAAVHRCFSSRLAPSQRPVFLVNSRLSLLPATPSSSTRMRFTLTGHPFFRRYGVNLPSSLTEDRSSTSRYLPLPTSDGLRYGRSWSWCLEAFLGGMGVRSLLSPCGNSRRASVYTSGGFAYQTTYT